MEGKNLVIVESPGKVKTIQKFLGKDFQVRASIGHIRDLEEKNLSIDIDGGFTPKYVVPAGKRKIVAELKALSDKADIVWLASDEDREGEAISWHLKETLNLPADKTRRIVFHEITKNVILDAIQHPRDIDMHLVDAQQARRVLDRLVGFELSPVLWKKIQPRLSAGRVQSVALRLVVEREKEIMAFQPTPYYKIEATFHPEGTPGTVKVKALLDNKFSTPGEAKAFLDGSIGAKYAIDTMEKKDTVRYPAPPFTTSTLQQEAARKLHYPVSTTMRIAQSLYEKGLITYMRTDSTNLSAVAIAAAKTVIADNFGPEYLHSRQYHTHTKGAQEAHEAIRPTHLDSFSAGDTAQEKKLYELIWKRTVASQMSESRLLATTIRIRSDKSEYLYVVNAQQMVFDGFMKVYMEGRDDDTDDGREVILPELHVGDSMDEKGITAQCKFTQAPPRYSEPMLVKKLEELGIGRPSTYAPTITVLTTGRGYLVRGDKDGRKEQVTNFTLRSGKITEAVKTETVGAERGKLLPQEIGMIVTDFLEGNFPEIVDYDFTANVEKDFDMIAEGEKPWNSSIASFYGPFHEKIQAVLGTARVGHTTREIGIAPDGDKIIASFGKFGAYVQKGEGDGRQYASLGNGQLIENVTLEEALKLFALPRRVGEIDGVDVIANKGKFGPYLRYGVRNIGIPKNMDPLTITLEECKTLIEANPAPEAVLDFGDIKVLKGRYGPYIKSGKNNYRIPKGQDVTSLTLEDCRKIIAASKK